MVQSLYFSRFDVVVDTSRIDNEEPDNQASSMDSILPGALASPSAVTTQEHAANQATGTPARRRPQTAGAAANALFSPQSERPLRKRAGSLDNLLAKQHAVLVSPEMYHTPMRRAAPNTPLTASDAVLVPATPGSAAIPDAPETASRPVSAARNKVHPNTGLLSAAVQPLSAWTEESPAKGRDGDASPAAGPVLPGSAAARPPVPLLVQEAPPRPSSGRDGLNPASHVDKATTELAMVASDGDTVGETGGDTASITSSQ